MVIADGSNIFKLINSIKPSEGVQFSRQSHVKIFFDIPEYTSDITGLGTLRILESIRATGLKKQNITKHQALKCLEKF